MTEDDKLRQQWREAQRRRRERLRLEGLQEVRGIYAPVTDHDRIKVALEKLGGVK